MEPAVATPCKEVSQGSKVAVASCVETIKQLVHNAGFYCEVAKAISTDCKNSTPNLLSGEWSSIGVVGKKLLHARPLYIR